MEGKAPQHCGFADEIVGYLYQESSDVERVAFEDHLLACAPCTDEFAEISHSRFSVYEWQREEFAPLETPRFAIPYEEERVGILAGLRELFSPRWAVPAFAMATIVAVGIVMFVLSLNDTPLNIADGPSDPSVQSTGSNPDVAPVSSTVESVAVPKKIDVASKTTNVLVAPRPVANTRPARIVEKKNVERTPRFGMQATVTAPLKTPVLSSEGETDDRSLRLSDLFDSDGTR